MVMIVYIIIVIPARPPSSLDDGDNHYYDEDHEDNAMMVIPATVAAEPPVCHVCSFLLCGREPPYVTVGICCFFCCKWNLLYLTWCIVICFVVCLYISSFVLAQWLCNNADTVQLIIISGIICVVDNAISSPRHSNVCEMTLQSKANCAQSSKRWVGSWLVGPHNNPRYPVRVWQPQYPPTQPTFSFLVDHVTNNSCHHPCQSCVCVSSLVCFSVHLVCVNICLCVCFYMFLWASV